MNKCMFLARLAKDPEIRYSQGANQTAVATFSIAVNRVFKREGEQDADFFNCIAFGKQAEFIERYLQKGMKVVLSGRMQNKNYTNKEGQMVYGNQVIVEEIEFAESKKASQENNNSAAQNTSSSQSSAGDGFMNIPDGIDEELPFN